jgi:trehalose 6-phosphate synthase/phosphatase
LAESKKLKIKWIGLVNYKIYNDKEQEEITKETAKHGAYPIFLDKEIIDKCTYYYDSVITPIFHNFVSYKNNAGVRNKELYEYYCKMNQKFVENILVILKKYPEATIIFNDPYFLLAPKYISKVKSPKMGYFFHSPFPSYEIYRIFPAVQQFMESLLCCDVVAFQVYEYARHFFTSCHRLLGLEAESRRGGMLGIIYKGRDVLIRVCHVGISIEHTISIISSKDCRRESIEFDLLAGKRTIIASVDKLSPISGIKNKLLGYKKLLEQHPQYYEKLVLIQYCTATSQWEFTKEASDEINNLVNEINSKFPDSVIYSEGIISTIKRIALFSVAEILLITSLRDGFCLTPFEYMVVKNQMMREAKSGSVSVGKVILSELAGCVSAMSSICRLNPYIIKDITTALYNVLENNGTSSNNTKFQHDIAYIKSHSAIRWVCSLIKDIKASRIKNKEALYLGAISNKILKAGRSFQNLLPEELEKKYAKAVNRVILLGCDGIVVPAMPPKLIHATDIAPIQILQLLESLCKDERNNVYIVSSKPKFLIDRWFGLVPKLGLAAECGFHYRFNNEDKWQTVKIGEIKDWIQKTLKLFEQYRTKTDGSDIENKEGSLAWIYEDCDPEFGNWQAQELEKELKLLLVNYPDISITHDKASLEVKLKGLEKGECARILIEEAKRKGNIDFILTMGEAITNEHMFKTITEMYAQENGKPAGRMKDKNCTVFTCTVGRKPSHANYYVNDYNDVMDLLKVMVLCSIKIPKSKSLNNLAGFTRSKNNNHSPAHNVTSHCLLVDKA